jgi:hypothetical protein
LLMAIRLNQECPKLFNSKQQLKNRVQKARVSNIYETDWRIGLCKLIGISTFFLWKFRY